MTALPVADDLLDRLATLDTPTVCNALEEVMPQNRGHGFTTLPLVCPFPALKPIVGFARTGTIRAQHPPRDDAETERDRRLGWYRHVAEGGPLPAVVVLQDVDETPGYGAFWGEVNTTVHQALGALGCITNGSIRDIEQCAEGFQLLAGCIGPSHAWARIERIAVPVTVAGMEVRDGDLIHADRHGAVVIPPDAAPAIPDAADRIARREAVILEAARQPGFDVDALAAAMGRSRDIH
jgi:regulator of RNase E activity RraA